MKVKELISKLQEFDEEMEVIINRFDGFKIYKDKLKLGALEIEYGATTYDGDKMEKCLAID